MNTITHSKNEALKSIYVKALLASAKPETIPENGMFGGLKISVVTLPLPKGCHGLIADPQHPEEAVFLMNRLWLCKKCGCEFEEADAASIQVADDSEEYAIACPQCHSNILDDPDSLVHPSDR